MDVIFKLEEVESTYSSDWTDQIHSEQNSQVNNSMSRNDNNIIVRLNFENSLSFKMNA